MQYSHKVKATFSHVVNKDVLCNVNLAFGFCFYNRTASSYPDFVQINKRSFAAHLDAFGCNEDFFPMLFGLGIKMPSNKVFASRKKDLIDKLL